MPLRTLGGVVLEDASLTRPKPLLLLTYLALEGPQNRRFLAELFWPGAVDHMKNLTVALARIRKGAPGLVETDGERAWTEVETDAGQFLARLEQGDIAGAVALYRGPFLDGFYLRTWSAELEEWVYKTRELLAGHARRARLELADKEAAQARFEAAARQAEQAYELAGAVAEPEELARLHTLMLAGDSLKAAEVRKEAEAFGLPLAESAEAARERLSEALGPLAPQTPHNLPVRGTAFVGRDLELTEVATLLARRDCQLLTLVGPAGIGKMRLALQIAWEQLKLGGFGGGIHLVALESLTSPGFVPTAVADALGLELQGSGEILKQVSDHIGDKHLLLILDSFEHLMDGATLMSDLARGCPNLTLLVTSRERLNLEEERIFAVAGLAFPQDDTLPLEEARRFDAVRLFVRRAGRAKPTFDLTDETLPHVLKICRLVEGLPLGLELAAAWVRALPCSEIAGELERNLDLLSTPTRNVPERHRSLRSAFEHSWRLLSAKEQEVLRKLSVFRGGFRREAASEVAGATIPVLASLADKSLLRVDATGRYDRHPLIYQYTQEKLAERPEEEARARARHGQYYLGLLQTWEDELAGGVRQRKALTIVEEELENVHIAWSWAATKKRLTELWDGCRPLQLFYIQRGGLVREGVKTFSQAAGCLDAADPSQGAVLGRLLIAEAWFRYLLADYQRSERAAKRGLELLRSEGAISEDCQGIDRAITSGLNTLGNIAKSRGELMQAEQHFSDALHLAKTRRNQAQIAIITNNLALLKKAMGSYREAEQLYRAALELNRARSNDRSVVRNLTNLGALMVLAGNAEKAEQVLQEGVRLAKDIGYHDMLPNLLTNLGGAAYVLGDYQKARALYQEGLELKGKSGDRVSLATSHCWLGRVEAALGNYDLARRHSREALELAWDLRDFEIVYESLINLAELHSTRDNPAGAAALLGLIKDQAGLTHTTRDRIRDLIGKLNTLLSPAKLGAALERGKAMKLEDVVAQVFQEAALRS